jgi:hypothetical protein
VRIAGGRSLEEIDRHRAAQIPLGQRAELAVDETPVEPAQFRRLALLLTWGGLLMETALAVVCGAASRAQSCHRRGGWRISDQVTNQKEDLVTIRTWSSVTLGLLALAIVTLGAQPSTQPSATDKVRITGWALNMSNIATGANQTIQIDINGWSNPSQRQHLIETFLEKKQQGLVRELEDQPELGRFRFPGYMGPDPNNIMRLGTDIRYAMNHPGEDGGRRIVIITPRVIGFREARNQPRTTDYPFTLFEMRFDANGRGEGRMAYATQIAFDKGKNAIELENYSSEPVRLNELKLEVTK